MSRFVAEQLPTKLKGILSRRVRQFVNKRLGEESVLCVVDRTPCSQAHVSLYVVAGNVNIRNCIGNIRRVFAGAAREISAPCQRYSVLGECALVSSERGLTIKVVAKILFAAPNEFDRLGRQLLGDAHRLIDVVEIAG